MSWGRRGGLASTFTLALPVCVCVWVAAAGCARGASAQAAADYLSPLALPAVGPVGHRVAALRGQPVAVIFFATWCFPCLGQLGLMAELQREFADAGLKVVAVGMDLEGERVLEPFARQGAYPYPVLVAGDRLRSGETAYGAVQVLPSTVVLDREGQVVAAWAELVSADRLRDAVERAAR